MKNTLLLIFFLAGINLCIGQTVNPVDGRLSQQDVEHKTISELWVLRNSIFAKYGRPFKTYELHTLFMKQAWYKPDKNYQSSDLTDTDVYNVNLIAKQESKLRENDFEYTGSDTLINFNNVYNTFQYPVFRNFDKEKLSENGFIVYPTTQNQLFHIYENNDYLGIPSFITADAVLQLYHLFFDLTLRNIEEKHLSPRLYALLNRLIAELESIQSETVNQHIKNAIDLDLAYLGIARYFLQTEKTSLPGNLKEVATREIGKCEAHAGFDQSEILDRKFDYSQFIPRGHYTRNETLKRFFMSMMWLGNAGIELTNETNTLGSVLITYVLYNKTYEGEPLIDLWEEIYEPTVFYIGLSDDTGPNEMNRAIDEIFTQSGFIERFDNPEKLNLLAENLESAKIKGHGDWGKQNKQFRLMGQRFIPDSYIFDRLTNKNRKMPNSLDIMAGFGNKKAYELMMTEYKTSWDGFPAYPDTLNRIIDENQHKTKTEWSQNLYYHWLYNLKALYEIKNKHELPFFMTTDGWETKTLNTTLASWAELRHNTILYAKQSYAAECGGEGDEVMAWIPEPPKGYVEPNVEFYDRMLSLLHFTTQGLALRNMLDNRIKYVSNSFTDLLSFLKSIAEKEINGENLTLEEYDQIQRTGSLLDNLTLRVLTEEAYDWRYVEGPDKNMPVIADVHTADNEVLEVGVGQAHAIYVIVEIEGKLKLLRGAIFSYFEFPWPASDRLTDEKWQKMLKLEKQPDQPGWINYKSNIYPERELTPLYKPDIHEIPDSSTEPGWKMIYYGTGC